MRSEATAPASAPEPEPGTESQQQRQQEQERDLLALPALPVPDPQALVVDDPPLPTGGRTCAACGTRVGLPIGGRPVLADGYCTNCGTPYTLRPQLRPRDLLDGGRYEVTGCLTHGGQGWIYLGVDTRLDRRPLVLKCQIDPHDEHARRIALEERNHLITLDDANIVRIHDYITHRSGGDQTDYLVMEFVGGKSLHQIVREAGRLQRPLGPDEPLTLEHAVRYGCKILEALASLHGKRLVYSDMKPDNVIHHGDRVKVIDLGGVRRDDDTTTAPVYTRHYAPPETLAGRLPTVAHDLYTVGRTLRVLADAREANAARPGLGIESFDRLVARATHTDPRRRFASAAEMRRQLHGVLREMASLRTGRQHTEPSELFEPTTALLDAGLGTVPAVDHWLTGTAKDTYAPPLDTGRPSPFTVATGLPVPVPRPDDPNIVQLRLSASHDPRGVLRQLDALPAPSVEVRLRLLRAQVALGNLEGAERLLTAARSLLGGDTPDADWRFDWRIDWHSGLLSLATADVTAAEGHFEAVYDALPGEHAPKLALGYCAECRGDLDRAELLYNAVWQRNRQQGSAAFGLARIHLAREDRRTAADLLGLVPPASRHHDAAQIAATRIRAARLPTTGHGRRAGGLPDWYDLLDVISGFPRLHLDGGAKEGDERTRLAAEIRGWALAWIRGAGHEARARLGDLRGQLLGEPPGVDELRSLLSRSLVALAWLPGTRRRDREELIDRANRLRPWTWF